MIRLIGTWWDGDVWPVARFELKDSGVVKDSTNLAVEFFIRSGTTLIARRPGVMVNPKSSGLIDLNLRGAECDWDGAGKELTIYPKLFIPVLRSFAGGKWESTQATNLLLNPSFDTAAGSNPSRLPSNWTLVGAQTSEVFDNYANDTMPHVIFEGGTFQLVNPGATCVTTLDQQVAQATVAGDYVSFGCWVRGTGLTSAASNNAALKLLSSGGADDALTQLPGGAAGGAGFGFDWQFITVEKRTTVAHTNLTARLEYRGQPNASFRFDEANLFVGRYLVKKLEPVKIEFRPRRRIPKTSNQLAGIGGFEQDSNNDGLGDGWIHDGSFAGITATIDRDPANVRSGDCAQKLVMVNATAAGRIIRMERGSYKAGEQWTFSAWFKTNGAMSSAASIAILPDGFDGQRASTVSTAVGPSLGAYTQVSATITLLDNTSQLECRISVGGIVSGTLWVDDASLARV